MDRHQLVRLAAILVCALALVGAAAPAIASPAGSGLGQTPKPPLYQPDGNPCARLPPEFGGGGGRDIVGSSGNSAVLFKISNQGDPVTRAYFSPDGRTIVTSSEKTLRLWDARAGRNLKVLREPRGFGASAISPDGKQLAAIVGEDTVQILEIASGQVKRKFKLPAAGSWPRPVAYNADGRLLAAAGGTTAYVWEAATGRQILRTPAGRKLNDGTYGWGHIADINALKFTPNGQALVTAGWDTAIRMWDLGSGKHLRCYGDDGTMPYAHLDVSPDGRHLVAIPTTTGQMAQWDAYTGKLARLIEAPEDGAYTSVSFSPDNRSILASAGDYTARLWDTKTGALTGLMRHPGGVVWAGFNQDGRRVVSGVASEAWVWDASHKNVAAAARAENLQSEGAKLARVGDIGAGESKFREAKRQNPDRSFAVPDSESLNRLCWYGALWGEAERVLLYCEQAIQLASKNADYLDSRALARALAGDWDGAIKDYRFVIDQWTADYRNADMIAERQAWLDGLLAGEDPFDEATLAELINQK